MRAGFAKESKKQFEVIETLQLAHIARCNFLWIGSVFNYT
ncbi:MAG: hypothetical protein RUDDFDWM_000641 [Candidatus Fervidibacterota bacterium]